jgi:hypothetical protein
MSDFLLPAGSSIIATLFRPMVGAPEACVANLLAASALRAETVWSALRAQRVELLAALPVFLHPGAPVCLVVTITLPGEERDTHGFTVVAEMPRSSSIDDVGDRVLEMLKPAIEKCLGQIGAMLAAKAAA